MSLSKEFKRRRGAMVAQRGRASRPHLRCMTSKHASHCGAWNGAEGEGKKALGPLYRYSAPHQDDFMANVHGHVVEWRNWDDPAVRGAIRVSASSHAATSRGQGAHEHDQGVRRLAQGLTRRARIPRIKVENPLDGLINCPLCHEGLPPVATRGCSVVTCRSLAHNSSFHYFCYHCRKECPDGNMCAACPSRNTAETRLKVLQDKNKRNRQAPIDLT